MAATVDPLVALCARSLRKGVASAQAQPSSWAPHGGTFEWEVGFGSVDEHNRFHAHVSRPAFRSLMQRMCPPRDNNGNGVTTSDTIDVHWICAAPSRRTVRSTVFPEADATDKARLRCVHIHKHKMSAVTVKCQGCPRAFRVRTAFEARVLLADVLPNQSHTASVTPLRVRRKRRRRIVADRSPVWALDLTQVETGPTKASVLSPRAPTQYEVELEFLDPPAYARLHDCTVEDAARAFLCKVACIMHAMHEAPRQRSRKEHDDDDDNDEKEEEEEEDHAVQYVVIGSNTQPPEDRLRGGSSSDKLCID